jgi:hypothetical protein
MGVINAGHPGTFTAVAATGAYSPTSNRTIPVAAFLPLPVAVLVHANHRPDTLPVGVGVPYQSGGAIHVDAVLGSRSRRAWDRVRSSRVGVSILAGTVADHIDTDGVRVVERLILIAVDLVGRPSDVGSRIEVVRLTLSPEQRRTQQRFDDWLDRAAGPPGEAFFASASIDGVSAMDELGEIVGPLIGLQPAGGSR